MNCDKLKEIWKKEEEMSFKGWDFSYLNNRWEDEELPWNYDDILRKYLRPEYSLLDMGTGGGEFLLSLKHPYHKTSVTEMWPPNVEECKTSYHLWVLMSNKYTMIKNCLLKIIILI